jgi:hypothetical protein
MAAEVTNQLAEAHEDFRESMRNEIDLASLYFPAPQRRGADDRAVGSMPVAAR